MSVPQRPRPAGLPAGLDEDRTLVMGIVNVTPDSFSDGGEHQDPAAAVAHARRLLAEGADIIDVGGESTRPGAQRVEAEEELRRVLPVVRDLAAEGAVVSVDTMRAAVAEACVQAGALIVNDVSGGLADEQMGQTLAALRTARGAPPVVIAMHWRGHSAEMADLAVYGDVVGDVALELERRLDGLLAAGVDRSQLVVDPGLGFAKTGEQNWALLAGWEALEAHGLPILVGASRKRFLSERGTDPDAATAGLSAILARQGAWAVRVHAVAASVAAVRVGDRLRRSGR